ncbi:hypothetical protein OAE58_02265 [Akkermansiaceae bacterium]|nr:hypothetical protein [Akkermansiaceae bacterium]MDB4288362.1 hypothetical protein [bacterium]MDB4041663.1 hypothetical protein [Akkermansiaceae bacterium]MDB4287045.1 hypothetical protein [Akkermansiaceae bacterium]MDB4312743.1 hypothetical protein [Akkermansiaceae bacterium]
MSAERVFQVLLCSGLLAGGWLYGHYWQKAALPSEASGSGELRSENAELTRDLDQLRDELAQVRSLLSKGSLAIPEDLIAFVEKDSGMVFTKAPLAKLAAPDVLRNAAERNLDLLFGKGGVEKEEQAWTSLGLLPANTKLRGQWIAIETLGVRGLFDLTSGEILLSEDFDPMSIPDSGALVHQLARQLQLQNHPLPFSWKSADEARAWQAVHRGAAAGVEARYMRRRAAAEEIEWDDKGDDREALLLQLSPTMQGLANFPYFEGNNFAKKAYLDSRTAYLSIFKKPPTTTFGLLHPEMPPREEERTHSSQIGALGILLLFDPYLGNEAAEEIAHSWVDDAYEIQATTLTWRITLETPEIARTFVEGLQRIESKGRSINIDGTDVEVTVPFQK